MTIDGVTHSGVGTLKVTEDDIKTYDTELFQLPSYDLSMEESIECSFTADNLSSDGPYRIKCTSNDVQYMQTKNMHLLMNLSVTQSDGTATTDENYAIVNNIGGSLFNSVKVLVNGKQVSEFTQENYAFKAYLEKVFSCGPPALESQGTAGAFVVDTEGKFDVLTVDNLGYKARKAICAGSKEFQIFVPLSVDILQTDRLFLPNTELTLIFERSPDDFCLLKPTTNTETLKLKIHDMKVFLNYITLHPEVRHEHIKSMTGEQKKLALYPYQKTEIFTRQFGTGCTKLNIENCLEGVLPKTVIVGLLETNAFDGDYKSNPFNFQHFDVSNVHLRINNKSVPAERYSPDYTKKNYAREYKSMLNNLGVVNDVGSIITYKGFMGGYCFYAFDLSPDKCNGFHQHAPIAGKIDVRIELGKANTKGITVMVISTHDKMASFDENLNVSIVNM